LCDLTAGKGPGSQIFVTTFVTEPPNFVRRPNKEGTVFAGLITCSTLVPTIQGHFFTLLMNVHIISRRTNKYGNLSSVGTPGFLPLGAKVRRVALPTGNTHPQCTGEIKNKYKLMLTHCNANARIPIRPSNAAPCKVPPGAAALPHHHPPSHRYCITYHNVSFRKKYVYV